MSTHSVQLEFDWCWCCPGIFFKMWISLVRYSAVNGHYLKKRILHLVFCSFLSFFSGFWWFFWLHLSFFCLWCIFLHAHILIFETSLQMHRRSKELLWKPHFCWLKLMIQANVNPTEWMDISIVVAEIGPSRWLSHGYTLQEKPTAKLHLRSIIGKHRQKSATSILCSKVTRCHFKLTSLDFQIKKHKVEKEKFCCQCPPMHHFHVHNRHANSFLGCQTVTFLHTFMWNKWHPVAGTVNYYSTFKPGAPASISSSLLLLPVYSKCP